MMFTKNELGKELQEIIDNGIGQLKESGKLNELAVKYGITSGQ